MTALTFTDCGNYFLFAKKYDFVLSLENCAQFMSECCGNVFNRILSSSETCVWTLRKRAGGVVVVVILKVKENHDK